MHRHSPLGPRPRRVAIAILAAVCCLGSPAAVAQTMAISEGDVWDFFRGRVAPDADWADPDYDAVAAGWESGPSGIGYGDDDDATVLEDMSGSYVSVYLRRAFTVDAALADFVWLLRVRYDDGFVAYLDGREILRRGLTGAPPAFDELAADHEIAAATGFDEEISLASLGVSIGPGEHLLAVEVHNGTLGSSDLSFSAELAASPFLVTAIDPGFGPPEGGNAVTLAGAGFRAEDVPAVRFGERLSSAVTVESAAQLVAIVPARTDPGPVDVSVTDARGTVVLAGAYTYSSGRSGLRFGGVTRAVASGLDVTGEGTIEVWFRRDGEPFLNPWRVLVAVQGDGADAFRIEAQGDQVRARIDDGGTFNNLTAAVTLGVDEWHHIAFAFDASGRRLYFDGREVAADDRAIALPAGALWQLGGSFTAGGGVFGVQSFQGVIESARVWGLARDGVDIARDAFRRIERDSPAGPNLQAAWPLDDGGGQLAADIGPRRLPLLLGQSESVEESDPAWFPIEDFPLIAITLVDPDTGAIGGNEIVEIFGVGFGGDEPPAVFFGGRPATDVVVLDPWALEAVTPGGAAFGAVDVVVQSAAGTATLAGGFLYRPEGIVPIIEEGDVWSWFVGATAPPPEWNQDDFDAEAAGWASGPTGIGYGDDDDATVIDGMVGVAASLYARREFAFPGSGDRVRFLRLRVRYDDSFVAYLNGVEIGRANLTGEPPAFDELANDQHEITGGNGVFDVEIDILAFKNSLQRGSNSLAIEVHNATLDSTDLSLSAELHFAAEGPRFLRGDTDRSGTLTVTDAVLLLLHSYSGSHISCTESADVNDDGRLGTTDAVVLLQHLFLRGRPPAAPFPLVWPDLDNDTLECES